MENHIDAWLDVGFPTGNEFELLNLSEALSRWPIDEGTLTYSHHPNALVLPHYPTIDEEAFDMGGGSSAYAAAAPNLSLPSENRNDIDLVSPGGLNMVRTGGSEPTNPHRPSSVPFLDPSGFISIRSDHQSAVPESARSSSLPTSNGHGGLESHEASSRQLGYHRHGSTRNRRRKSSDHTRLVERKERLLRERSTAFGSFVYKIEHKCRECNVSFLTGNALGGHMSSHAKRRKTEEAAARIAR